MLLWAALTYLPSSCMRLEDMEWSSMTMPFSEKELALRPRASRYADELLA